MATEDGRPVGTLRDYLDVVQRRKWLILFVVLLVPAIAFLLSMRQPALYQASAQVLISRENLATQLYNLTDPSLLDATRIANTQAQLARVPEVARRALEAANVRGRDPSDLLGASSVTPTEETDLLVFNVTDPNPELAARLATEYARQFTNYRLELDVGSLQNARKRLQQRIDALEAAGDRDSALYGSLVEKEQQLGTMEALQAGRAKVVRPATGAGQIQPQPRRAATFGFALGLVLAVALAFLREALDSRVRSAGEIGERLRLPLLGRIPTPPRKLRRKKQLVMLEAPTSHDAEAFRLLLAQLRFMGWGNGGGKILVTSADAGEGKSTTAANLAVAFARVGLRVSLVDLDLREPFLHRIFRLEATVGIADVVRETVELDDAIRVVQLGQFGREASINGHNRIQLELLPSGTSPENPGEFISHDAVGDILDALSREADVVLVDAPPLLHASDAIALTSRVDALILITRAQRVKSETLDHLRRVLDACPTQKLGFVLTAADRDSSYYGGYTTGGNSSRSIPTRRWQRRGKLERGGVTAPKS